MVKFVWLTGSAGGQIPVNPRLITHLAPGRDGRTQVMFVGGTCVEIAEDHQTAVQLLQLHGNPNRNGD